MKGGDKIRARLAEIAAQLGNPATLRVGFLENATYPDTTKHETRKAYSAKKKLKDTTALAGSSGGVSVPMVAATQEYGAPAAGIPPRPFMRPTAKNGEKTWGPEFAKILKAADYNGQVALGRMGERIKSQIQRAIIAVVSPPLAKATAAAKGFTKPLVDTGHMLHSVDYEVKS